MQPKILAFAGSARTDSFNAKLVRIAAAGATEAGADVTILNMREFEMPMYDGDLESNKGIPATAKKFKELMKSHDGFLISSPEYNSSITPLLKNAIDWASRSEPGEPSLIAYKDKVAGLLSASPGGLGGLRGLVHLRSILGNIGTWVIPDQVSVSSAHEAFEPTGTLKDAKKANSAKQIGAKVVDTVRKMKSA